MAPGCQQAKVYGVVVAPQFPATLATSWDLVIRGIQRVLHEWAAQRLPPSPMLTDGCPGDFCCVQDLVSYPNSSASISQRRRAFAMPLVTFCGEAGLSALPTRSCISPSQRAASTFLQLPLEPRLFSPNKLATATLGVAGLPPHLAFWIGLLLRPYLPALGSGLHAEDVPPMYKDSQLRSLQKHSMPSSPPPSPALRLRIASLTSLGELLGRACPPLPPWPYC
jgi:hypothetical protein